MSPFKVRNGFKIVPEDTGEKEIPNPVKFIYNEDFSSAYWA